MQTVCTHLCCTYADRSTIFKSAAVVSAGIEGWTDVLRNTSGVVISLVRPRRGSVNVSDDLGGQLRVRLYGNFDPVGKVEPNLQFW